MKYYFVRKSFFSLNLIQLNWRFHEKAIVFTKYERQISLKNSMQKKNYDDFTIESIEIFKATN